MFSVEFDTLLNLPISVALTMVNYLESEAINYIFSEL